MQFKLSRRFHASLSRYFTPDALADLFVALTHNPLAGRVVPNLRGARKVRVIDRIRSLGARGGLRVIYRYIPHRDIIVLYLAYRKSDQSDLLPHQRDYILNYSSADLSLDEIWPPENNN